MMIIPLFIDFIGGAGFRPSTVRLVFFFLAEGGTPLHLAAFNDRAEVVRVLLDSGADVKVTGIPMLDLEGGLLVGVILLLVVVSMNWLLTCWCQVFFWCFLCFVVYCSNYRNWTIGMLVKYSKTASQTHTSQGLSGRRLLNKLLE